LCSHREQGFIAVEDRKGMRFPVRCVCGYCTNVIYNSLPVSLHTFVKKGDPVISGAAGWICVFTTESGTETEKILRWYSAGGEDTDASSVFREYTTGHYRKSAL
jgi:putative protease